MSCFAVIADVRSHLLPQVALVENPLVEKCKAHFSSIGESVHHVGGDGSRGFGVAHDGIDGRVGKKSFAIHFFFDVIMVQGRHAWHVDPAKSPHPAETAFMWSTYEVSLE